MPKKRFSDEQIAFALRQAEARTTVGEIAGKWGLQKRRSTSSDGSSVASTLWRWLHSSIANIYPASADRSRSAQMGYPHARASTAGWMCHGLMPLRLLTQAAFLSNARGFSSPGLSAGGLDCRIH